MSYQKKAPEAGGTAQGGENNTASSPYSSAILEAVAVVCSAFSSNLLPAKPDWRDGLAQSSPRFRNCEHKTFVTADSREARRKLARLAKKGKGVKP